MVFLVLRLAWHPSSLSFSLIPLLALLSFIILLFRSFLHLQSYLIFKSKPPINFQHSIFWDQCLIQSQPHPVSLRSLEVSNLLTLVSTDGQRMNETVQFILRPVLVCHGCNWQFLSQVFFHCWQTLIVYWHLWREQHLCLPHRLIRLFPALSA